jgi:hypothetical protein
MKKRILSAALLVVAGILQTHAACIGCINTTALFPGNQSTGYSSLGSKESLYIDYGAEIEVYSGDNINNTSSQFTSNNYGKEQNSPKHSYNQHITNKYWLASRPVMPGKGSINNVSGFGINFQIMEKSKNLFSPNQLIYNI